MTIARSQILDPSVTSYYHCIARCVRRAYLCGEDKLTKKNFDHRKTWLVDQMKFLSDTFAIQICAYAVMSNHYHQVLHVNRAQARDWTDYEVIQRWCRLFQNPLAVRYLQQETLLEEELTILFQQRVPLWRGRLASISWYMRCLNETIARLANAEDDCTGRFWEGRFRCQALLDETAILSCMVYVDLNPIRAGIAKTMEESEFTSIQERIRAYQQKKEASGLMLFSSGHPQAQTQDGNGINEACLDFRLEDYFDLVDSTGRLIRQDKRGAIPFHVPKLLTSLRIDASGWADNLDQIRRAKKIWVRAA